MPEKASGRSLLGDEMKILAIADVESKALWDYFDKTRLEGVDLIISAGDLNPHYLSFLATFTKAPVLYIHGNHDERYEKTPPDGCICIEDQVYNYKGLRIAGLGGCMRYKPGPNMYTEREMQKKASKLRRQIARNHGIDILVTHAPAFQLNDGDDMPHMGFKCFLDIMDRYQPSLFIHGHVHANYGGRFKRESVYGSTRVVNAFERYEIELEDKNLPEQSSGRLSGVSARLRELRLKLHS